MKEVKSPRKPLIYYYGIVLLVVILFNVFISPLLSKNVVEEVDYGTFMRMTEEKKIGRVEVEDSQILFTEKDNEKPFTKPVSWRIQALQSGCMHPVQNSPKILTPRFLPC